MSYRDRYSSYYGRRTFEQRYRCRAAVNPQVEGGDKVVLPPSALARLDALRIEYPMLFELHTDDAAQRVSHCGVLEFVAEEGTVVMPHWMMRNMLLHEGDVVRLRSAALPKGTYVKLQPHTSDFLDVSNPKAVLERTLRNFATLTTGDSIMLAYNNKDYYIDIVETKPAPAVTIIDTDCEVDFAPPLDYKEPEKPQKPAASSAPATKAPAAEDAAKDEPKFKPFTGSGKRLDGKPTSKQEASGSGEVPSTDAPSAPSAIPGGSSNSSNPTRQKTGKLVFGSSASSSNKQPQKAPAKEKEPPKKDEPPKFQAFTGKSYSLNS